jgi:hypothetical protein
MASSQEHESNKSGQITVTHERMQELIAIGVKSSLKHRSKKHERSNSKIKAITP